MIHETVYLTPQGFEKLQNELEYLRNVKRMEVARRLQKAIEDGGDNLAEDAEYAVAKNEQAFVEGRIRYLETLLAKARVYEKSGQQETIQVGAKVTIQQDGTDPEVYIIVGPEEANPRQGMISYESPLGKALLNRRVGEVVEVKAPSGTFTVQILKVE
jgi:transcription elongation factor GreA